MNIAVYLFRVAVCRSRSSFVSYSFRADQLFIPVARSFCMFHLLFVCIRHLLSIVLFLFIYSCISFPLIHHFLVSRSRFILSRSPAFFCVINVFPATREMSDNAIERNV